MSQAYVVDAVRTPVGKRGGALSAVHPADLAAEAIAATLGRNDVDPARVDDVVFGCVDAIGPQAGNIARTAWLAAGFPEDVPGVTVDRQCGSSQQSIHFAAQAVMGGTAELVVAGGVARMSRIPIASAMAVGAQFGFATPVADSTGWRRRYATQEVSQYRGAELIAAEWDISRAEMERWALRSHQRAATAIKGGRFEREIVPVGDFAVGECPRETSMEKMAALPALIPGGRLTAAVASQIADAVSAVLIASEQALAEHHLTARARIHHLSARGADPIAMLGGPIPATEYALDKTGLSIDDVDVIEINEAFAPVVLAWMKAIGADPDRVNVNGGAIALGHPLGATGAKLFASLLCELERTRGRFGLLTICEGGGTANVTIIERLG
jgi:acetyl-CoA C-acetyltransferase